MKEDKFWQIIANLDYAKDLDDGRVGADLVSEKFCTIEEAHQVEDIFNEMYGKLENEMDAYLDAHEKDYDEVIGLGDDGLSDLLSHVIGLGKENYYKCYNNIYELGKHASGGFNAVDGYTESFSYAFHALD